MNPTTDQRSLPAYHQPVMLAETIDLLSVRPAGVYLDATAGGGGHTAAILERLGEGGSVVALDRDSEAHRRLEARFDREKRVVLVRTDFAEIGTNQTVLAHAPYAGVLFDFGLSSRQIDDPARGFSFSQDGPLDMRMDDRLPLTAAEVVNGFEEADLVRLFRENGEEPQARRIAHEVVASRPLNSTGSLAEVVRRVVKGPKQVKALARVFQAIRIEVNGELAAIDRALPSAVALLGAGGRLVTLAYHSLEDRRVKEFFRISSQPEPVDPFLPQQEREVVKPLRMVTRGAVKATEAEIETNPRARSARLRAAERTG